MLANNDDNNMIETNHDAEVEESTPISTPKTTVRKNRLQKAADKKRKLIKDELPPLTAGTSTACPINADEEEEDNAEYAEDSEPIPLTRPKRAPAKNKRIL